MKKVNFLLLVAFLLTISYSFSQSTSPTDFYVGKWEVVISGTPQGDSKMVVELVRKDGKLTGQLTNTADPTAEKIPLTSVVENGDKLALGFTAQGYDLTIDLAKVDNDNLKGSMMNFDTTAKRIK